MSEVVSAQQVVESVSADLSAEQVTQILDGDVCRKISQANGKQTIGRGAQVLGRSYSETTAAIQAVLKKVGFYKGDVDGKFGDLTVEAVVAFQKANHLKKVDGIVGSETLQPLRDIAQQQTASLPEKTASAIVPAVEKAPAEVQVPPPVEKREELKPASTSPAETQPEKPVVAPEASVAQPAPTPAPTPKPVTSGVKPVEQPVVASQQSATRPVVPAAAPKPAAVAQTTSENTSAAPTKAAATPIAPAVPVVAEVAVAPISVCAPAPQAQPAKKEEAPADAAVAKATKAPHDEAVYAVSSAYEKVKSERQQREAEIKKLQEGSGWSFIQGGYECLTGYSKQKSKEAETLTKLNSDREDYENKLRALTDQITKGEVTDADATLTLGQLRERFDGKAALQQRYAQLKDNRQAYEKIDTNGNRAFYGTVGVLGAAAGAAGAVYAAGALGVGATASSAVAVTGGGGTAVTTGGGGAASAAVIDVSYTVISTEVVGAGSAVATGEAVGGTLAVASEVAAPTLAAGASSAAGGVEVAGAVVSEAGTVAQSASVLARSWSAVSNAAGRVFQAVRSSEKLGSVPRAVGNYFRSPKVIKSAATSGAVGSAFTVVGDAWKGKGVGETTKDAAASFVRWGTVGAFMPAAITVTETTGAAIGASKAVNMAASTKAGAYIAENGGRVISAGQTFLRNGLPFGIAYSAEQTVENGGAHPIETIKHLDSFTANRLGDVAGATIIGGTIAGVLGLPALVPLPKGIAAVKDGMKDGIRSWFTGSAETVVADAAGKTAADATANSAARTGQEAANASASVPKATDVKPPVQSNGPAADSVTKPAAGARPRRVWPPQARYDADGNSLRGITTSGSKLPKAAAAKAEPAVTPVKAPRPAAERPAQERPASRPKQEHVEPEEPVDVIGTEKQVSADKFAQDQAKDAARRERLERRDAEDVEVDGKRKLTKAEKRAQRKEKKATDSESKSETASSNAGPLTDEEQQILEAAKEDLANNRPYHGGKLPPRVMQELLRAG